MKKLFTHLTFYVLIAIIAGILLGHYSKDWGLKMEVLGTSFVAVIKVFVVPIIFLTIVLGIASMGNLKQVGRIGLKSLIYFELVTTLALAIGIGIALLVEPGKFDSSSMPLAEYKAKPKEVMTILKFLKDYMSLLTLGVALICGVALNFYNKRQGIISKLEVASKFVFKVLKYVMYFAPIAAFGAMAFTVAKYGLDKLVPLGKMVLCVYGTMILFIVLVLGAIMRYYKLSIFKFLRYIRDEILIVLGTSSSESALPKLMEKLELAGCKKAIVGLVVPTGYSFNLDGTSIYLSMAVIFLAQVNNVSLSFGEIMMMIGILMLTSKGAAGVAGSGFVVLSSTIVSFPQIPEVSLAFLLGIDKFLSEARAITNFIGNGVATLVIAKSENEFDQEAFEREVSAS
ncbi:MAG: cation:dicarboxylase symporter family transporter [Bacteroidota bacterium]